ncbi:hypothetical protein J6590_059506 [Homalodisca vitripennis]|nr:hypothetical protein J6590_059506 [Homalodisca vitripennis]
MSEPLTYEGIKRESKGYRGGHDNGKLVLGKKQTGVVRCPTPHGPIRSLRSNCFAASRNTPYTTN